MLHKKKKKKKVIYVLKIYQHFLTFFFFWGVKPSKIKLYQISLIISNTGVRKRSQKCRLRCSLYDKMGRLQTLCILISGPLQYSSRQWKGSLPAKFCYVVFVSYQEKKVFFFFFLYIYSKRRLLYHEELKQSFSTCNFVYSWGDMHVQVAR